MIKEEFNTLENMCIPFSFSLALHKAWKQRVTASLAVPKDNKLHLASTASLKLIAPSVAYDNLVYE